MVETPRRTLLLLALGVASVSTAAVLIRLAAAPALAIAAWRMTLAALVVLPLAARRRAGGLVRSYRPRLPLVAAGIFLGLHFALWISSLELTSVASSVVLVCSNPIWVGLASPLVLGERPSGRLWFGVLLAFIGGSVIAFADRGQGQHALRGDLLALGGAWAAAAYFLVGRRWRTQVALLDYIAPVYATAAVLLVALAVLRGVPLWHYDRSTWLCFALLALVPQLLGHTSFNWALASESAMLVAGSVLGEALGSVVLAWMILSEAPTRGVLAGSSILLAGLLVAATDRPSRSQPLVSFHNRLDGDDG